MNYLQNYFQKGLVGYWTMDSIEPQDCYVRDYTYNSNNLISKTVIDSNGSGAAYVKNKLYKEMNTEIFYSKNVTINIWAKKDVEGKVLFIAFGKELSDTIYSGIKFFSSFVEVVVKDYGKLSLSTNFTFDSTWKMYSLIIDDSDKSISMFQNGVKTNLFEYRYTGAGVLEYDGNDIQICDGKSFFIDEVRFYNRALTGADLITLFNIGVNHSEFKCVLEEPNPNYTLGSYSSNWDGTVEFKNKLNFNFSEIYYKVKNSTNPSPEYLKYELPFNVSEDGSIVYCYQKALVDIFANSSVAEFEYNLSQQCVITSTAEKNNEAFILNGNILCTKEEVDKILFKGEELEFLFVNKRYFYTYKLSKNIFPTATNYLFIKYKNEEFYDVSVTQNQLASAGDKNAVVR